MTREEFLNRLPHVTRSWTCPYFVFVMFSCISCIGFGLADGSTAGAVMAVLAGILGGGPLQNRVRAVLYLAGASLAAALGVYTFALWLRGCRERQ